jgi:methyl-accepting chemotaxis protein
VEQEHAREQAAADKNASLIGMAETIESETTTALRQVAARTTDMTQTADEMAELASRTSSSAHSAADASARDLANVQTVAAAAEQLSASIQAIGSQVPHSNVMVGQAVDASQKTRSSIEALNERVGRIGAVADMIGEISAGARPAAGAAGRAWHADRRWYRLAAAVHGQIQRRRRTACRFRTGFIRARSSGS